MDNETTKNQLAYCKWSKAKALRRMGKHDDAFNLIIDLKSEEYKLEDSIIREFINSEWISINLLIGNKRLLVGNSSEADIFYTNIGLSSSDNQFRENMQKFLFVYSKESEELDIIISFFELKIQFTWSPILKYEFIINLNKLARLYQVKAYNARAKYRKMEYKEYFEKAKNAFENVERNVSEWKFNDSILIDYAMFLFKQHEKKNEKEFSKIEGILMRVINSNDVCDPLVFKVKEKAIVIDDLSVLLENKDVIILQPRNLAYYLLTKLYHINNLDKKGVLEEYVAYSLSFQNSMVEYAAYPSSFQKSIEEYTTKALLFQKSFNEKQIAIYLVRSLCMEYNDNELLKSIENMFFNVKQ